MINFHFADESDDTELRAMLRANSMPSWVTMSMEREPSFLASLNRFGREYAVIARDGPTLVGMYLCAEHPVHINGQPTNFGYLGGLRVNPVYRHRLHVLRDGYASIRKHSGKINPETWYTSIATENAPARRLLEARLRDLPLYIAQGEIVTLALPQTRGKRLGLWRRPKATEVKSMCQVHNWSAMRYQLSPELTPERAVATGADFFVREVEGRINSCMALWNQQAYKQVVARAYRQPLAATLPIYNFWARLTKRIALPALNQQLNQSFLAFFAPHSGDDSDILLSIRDALAINSSEVLTLGLHAAHPALPSLIREFRPAIYRTIVYTVCFDQPPQWDARPVQPEVAVL